MHHFGVGGFPFLRYGSLEGSFPDMIPVSSAGFSSKLSVPGRAFPRSWPLLGAQKLHNNERTS